MSTFCQLSSVAQAIPSSSWQIRMRPVYTKNGIVSPFIDVQGCTSQREYGYVDVGVESLTGAVSGSDYAYSLSWANGSGNLLRPLSKSCKLFIRYM